jgi:hypothetical protein
MDDFTADIKRLLEEDDPTITVEDFVSPSDEKVDEPSPIPTTFLNRI